MRFWDRKKIHLISLVNHVWSHRACTALFFPLPAASLLALSLLTTTPLFAQAEAAATIPDPEVALVIDEQPLVSSRAAGMGGALSTLADDIDAAMFNPAGIGGLNWGKSKIPTLRKLYFPRVGGSINKNSTKLHSDLRKEGGTSDAALAAAVVDAHAGERQYAQGSMLLGMVLGRTLVAPFYDLQVAAAGRGEGTDLIDARLRSLSGVAYGFSATDTQERFSLGYSGSLINRKDTTGTFEYLNRAERKTMFAEQSATYSGISHNVGLMWVLAKTARPTLGIAAKNAGNTVLKIKSAGTGEGAPPNEDLITKQDLTLGFSVSPRIGKSMLWNLILEGQQLTDDDVTLAKKYRIGTELSYDGFGSYALLGLRGGYNDAGPSFGFSCNLGLIAVELAQQSVDIGIGNDKVIEQRSTATISVNVADY